MKSNKDNLVLYSLVILSTLLVFASIVFISGKNQNDVSVSDELFNEPECAYVGNGTEVKQTFCYPEFKSPITQAISFAKLSGYSEVVLNSAVYEVREAMTANLGNQIIIVGIHVPSNIKLFSNNLNRPAKIIISKEIDMIDSVILISADQNNSEIQLENSLVKGIEIDAQNKSQQAVWALNVKQGLEISNMKVSNADNSSIKLGYFDILNSINLPVSGSIESPVLIANNNIVNSFNNAISIYGDFVAISNNLIYQTISGTSTGIELSGLVNNIKINNNNISYVKRAIVVDSVAENSFAADEIEVIENSISNANEAIFLNKISNSIIKQNILSRNFLQDENYHGIIILAANEIEVIKNTIDGYNFGLSFLDSNIGMLSSRIGNLDEGNIILNSDFGVQFSVTKGNNVSLIENSFQSRLNSCSFSNRSFLILSGNLPLECNN